MYAVACIWCQKMSDLYGEAYYEKAGAQSCYSNYTETSVADPMYLNIAQAIASVFKPKMVLELGCGHGVILKHLQAMGIASYGVEISDYILSKSLVSTVSKSNLHQLPFSDHCFDLVFSCRVLEHVPDIMFAEALREMTRVCCGVQWHLLPMFEVYPYTGCKEAVFKVMRQDETHVQIHPYAWWIEQFSKVQYRDTHQWIQLFHDSDYLELSNCQFILSQSGQLSSAIQARLKPYNLSQLIKYHEQLKAAKVSR